MSDLERQIRAAIDAFNRRDWDRIARGTSDEFEFHDHIPPDGRVGKGPYASRAVTETSGDSAFADLVMEVAEIRELGDADGLHKTAVRIQASGAGKNSDLALSTEIGQLWMHKDGAPVRIEQFRSWEEALAAAG